VIEMCLIQAKRWTGLVGLESVHALTGVMADHNATTGSTGHHIVRRPTSRPAARDQTSPDPKEAPGYRRSSETYLRVQAQSAVQAITTHN
jgi:restriction endonuclease Mrr